MSSAAFDAPDIMRAALAGLMGLVLIGGVFWITFARPPSRRSDGGPKTHDAENYWRGDAGGPLG